MLLTQVLHSAISESWSHSELSQTEIVYRIWMDEQEYWFVRVKSLDRVRIETKRIRVQARENRSVRTKASESDDALSANQNMR
jgi:hypothetical protein